MAYRLVKGEFHLFYKKQRRVGSQPDGDSVWFEPHRPKLLRGLNGRRARYNKGAFTQLRFEAIDAVELHYKGVHQEMDSGIGARDFTLRQLGFRAVDYTGKEKLTVKDANPHPREGYILTRSIDPYGRPVSFVFAGATRRADGSEVFLDVSLLRRSLNAKLAQAGHAYPAFYTGLPTDLREEIVRLSNLAWGQDRGVWSKDDSMQGVRITGLSGLERLVLWPKLFRRLVSYFKDGNSGLGRLEAWLRADPHRDDALWIVSNAEMGNFHDILRISGNRLAMKYWPEDLVIVPR